MSSLIVWLTRPNSYEIYMGGDRRLQLWLHRPCYLHGARNHDRNWPSGKPKFVDIGWIAQDMSINAKSLLIQDEALHAKVWEQVILSCAPKGSSMEQAVQFSQSAGIKAADESKVTWREMFTNHQWEDQCNTPHKRFLLEIELRSNNVQRVIPKWSGRDHDQSWNTSDDMGAMIASEYYHPEENSDGLPF